MKYKNILLLSLSSILTLSCGENSLPKTFTLSFEDGTESRNYKEGDKLGELPSIVEKEGYEAYWTIDGVEVNEDSIYSYGVDKVALVTYKAKKYKIYFDMENHPSIEVTFNEPIGELPTVPSKKGTTNRRWEINGSLINEDSIYSYPRNTLASPKYDIASYSLDFEGSSYTKIYQYGERLGSLPEVPSKEGEHGEYYYGVWGIDGVEINPDSIYEYETSKSAAPIYFAFNPTYKDGTEIDLRNDNIAFLEGSSSKEEDISELIKDGYSFASKKMKLSWATKSSFPYTKVILSKYKDLSNPTRFVTYNDYIELNNLENDTEYYYCLEGCFSSNDSIPSSIYSFKTSKGLRSLDIAGVDNLRDIGSLSISYQDKKLKQGMIYRSANLDSLSSLSKAKLKEELGIRSELDLRESSYWKDYSYIDSSIKYLHTSRVEGGLYYLSNGTGTGINEESSKATLKEELLFFADESNYPLIFHCQIGRDRTGTLALILEGLLGVSEEDIKLDYLVSMLSESGNKDKAEVSTLLANFTSTLNYIKNSGVGSSLSSKTESYLKTAVGLTSEEISSIKNIMMEDR